MMHKNSQGLDPDPLITAAALAQLFASQHAPTPILIGVMPRWRFVRRHIPHSHQVWRPALSQPRSALLIEADGFTRWARRLGINADSHVVIWDERYDGARLWWAFQHYGHRNVQLLDGGLQAWRQAGLPIARGIQRWRRARLRGTFTAAPSTRFPIASSSEVLASHGNQDCQLWDCREHGEWSGRKRMRGAARAGRIPWANHLPWQLFRADCRQSSLFASQQALEQVISSHSMANDKRQLFYCQSGVRTTVAILALYRLGWPAEQLANYDGSWREWSRNWQLSCLCEPKTATGFWRRLRQCKPACSTEKTC